MAEKEKLVQDRMSKIVPHAKQIKIKKREGMKLNTIQQYEMECDKGQKLKFVEDIFATCETTQTYIFVNTK